MTEILDFPILNQKSINDEILDKFKIKYASDEKINLLELIDIIDFNNDWEHIKKWVIEKKLATEIEWKRTKKRIDVSKYFNGKYPENEQEFVELFIKKNEIKINYKGRLHNKIPIFYEGINVDTKLTETINEIIDIENILKNKNLPSTMRENKITDLKQLKQQERQFTDIVQIKTPFLILNDLLRKLRLENANLKLGLKNDIIADALNEWVSISKPIRKNDIFLNISYGILKQCEVDRNWDNLIKSSFDTSELSKEVIQSIIEKFFWQVKRKMKNLEITNHLMFVLLGPQGIGKSVWMRKITAILEELKTSANFTQLENESDIELFMNNYIIILDEMGYASKSDVDIIKNILSAEDLRKRVLYTNNGIEFSQNATFIGASNKELKQLINDTTGLRRFIGLRFLSNPDHKIINEIDFQILWKSVDENAEDPTEKYQTKIKTYQAGNRPLTNIEEWINYLNTGTLYKSSPIDLSKASPPSFWFKIYKEWERDNIFKNKMDITDFRTSIESLCRVGATETGFQQYKAPKNGFLYNFIGK